MSYGAESDPLCYPGTTVLINLFDLIDPGLLEEVEMAFFAARAEEIPDGRFDLPHYLALHNHLFQDVYSWAGQIRTVRIAKGGNWFCYPEHIRSELWRVFGELANPGDLSRMSKAQFASHIGHFLAELNAVHPFREGNGRTQMTFVTMLAKRAGFELDESKIVRERVLGAMIASFHGDEADLVAFLADAFE